MRVPAIVRVLYVCAVLCLAGQQHVSAQTSTEPSLTPSISPAPTETPTETTPAPEELGDPFSSTPSPSTAAPETPAPTTSAPVTPAPTTSAPETPTPTTSAPETSAPTTSAPETPAPTTPVPVTPAPTTSAPETPAPTTLAPVTPAPTTSAPETPAPTTSAPVTPAPTTSAPETPTPTTSAPETPAPTTSAPVTPAPTTSAPETPAPTTSAPVTPAPTTSAPETPTPTTSAPETPAPTTSAPVTPAPTTSAPETPTPTTSAPETPAPTTFEPGTVAPNTPAPTTPEPTTPAPTSPEPTTLTPTTPAPTTPEPTTPAPTTPEPTTPAPTTPEPTTPAPTTPEPTTPAPAPTTPAPTTPAPTTPEPTTPAPTTPEPTTPAPTTPEPTTPAPTTPEPTTPAPTTPAPTTPEPTTLAPTTPAPTTPEPTTPAPTTPAPTTPAPTTPAPTTPAPTTPAPTSAFSCGPRVRKSWATLPAADKQLYLDAVNASMVLGYHTLFMEVHSHLESRTESYRTCGFIYWHRRFLYAYESMLRSLEPRFACLTVPYWDYYADFAKRLSGECTSFQGCSTFLTDMGGSAGSTATVTINGLTSTGNCNNATFMANFCHSSSVSGSSCNRCVPRSDWLSKAFPSGFGYSSLARLLSGSYQYAIFSQNLQYGTHNSIHNTAMGAYGTMSMSADPIFYNHRATVDLVHQLFYDCQVGRTMTETEKKTGAYAFQQCVLSSSDVCPLVTANMTMNWQSATMPKSSAEAHPMLAPFFTPLPNQYWQWVSGTDLGAFSYTYEKDVLFGILQSSGMSCPKNKIRGRKLQSIRLAWDADVRTRAVVKTYNLFQNVYNSAMNIVSSNRDLALEQVELMECQYYKDSFGTVDNLSDEFKRNFGLPPTACTTCGCRLQDIAAGRKRIQLGGWKDTFNWFLN